MDSRGILEALRNIYGATRVAEELAGAIEDKQKKERAAEPKK